MSWDAYRDNLVASGNLDKVAIIGFPDGGVWTQSEGLNVSQAEGAAVAAGFSNSSGLTANGITVGGIKYFYLQSDDKQIQGKKGPSGVCIAKSTKCAIIGTYGEGKIAGNARKSVEAMCDYLAQNGY